MGMQTGTTEAQLVEARATQDQRRLVVAVWVLAALVAVLLVVTLVQMQRLSSLEAAVQRVEAPAVDSGAGALSLQLDETCRLLGAVAQQNGVPLASVFDGETMSTCEAAAGEGASAVRAGG